MEFIDDISDSTNFDSKFHTRLKPIFQKTVEFYVSIELPKYELNRWPIKFYLKFQNEDFFTPLTDLWNDDKLFSEKFVSVLLKRKKFFNMLLESIKIAIKVFPPLSRALKNKYPQNFEMSTSEVSEFLTGSIELLEDIGFKIQLPVKLKLAQKRGFSAKLLIGSKIYNQKSILGLDSLIDFRWEIKLFGKPLGLEDLKILSQMDNSLIRWKENKWIFINKEDLDFLKKIYETKRFSGKIKAGEVIKLELLGKYTNLQLRKSYKTEVSGNLKTKIENIKNKLDFKLIRTPKDFRGELRDYQQVGISWLAMLCDLGLGVCLGDDMGLGKTIQIIAYLLYRIENYPDKESKFLIVCPTSLLANWEYEIKRFAPKLNLLKYHRSNREKFREKIGEIFDTHHIILTSYGIIRNDIDFLQNIEFNGIIIDESTNIKNYQSKRARAIYLLNGDFRIALSGTPIENRLEELWSLFNFLNPGLLGSLNAFRKTFVYEIENHQNFDIVDMLKSIIDPFILRRLKTDKKVIKDLPEKNEIMIYVNLSEYQTTLYNKIVNDILREIRENYGNKKRRNGLILKLLTKLKQLCNHPMQYLKTDPSKYNFRKNIKEFIKQSPKIERIFDIVEEILENEQKVLIFSQYKKLGDILLNALIAKFGEIVSFFHGSLTPNQRDMIVRDFQLTTDGNSKILIVSLKAGGFGLNLTAGTTVIHVDRWWNPSIESQATDRAYRIGQDQNVNVYKFIAIGTIEEKINRLLEEKKDLSRQIITPTSSIISKLPIEEIEELFSLMT